MKTYLYPQNLKAAANLWLWGLKDFAVLVVAALIAVLILVNTGILVPVVAVLIYAFMTIRLEEITVMDFLRYPKQHEAGPQEGFWHHHRVAECR